MDKDIVILGAGISGIAAGYYGGRHKTIIYEKDDLYGGICGSFKLNGFIFDNGVHLSFTNNEEVRAIFDKIPYNTIQPHPQNIYNYSWYKHPIQNNLFNLPLKEKVKAIVSFCNKKDVHEDSIDYRSWLYSKYGAYITEKFFDGNKVNYSFLVSTILLTKLALITKDINEEIKEKAETLKATSILWVSLIIEEELNFDDIWFYIYDEDILPARAYLPGKKSLNNIEKGYSTIQFEIYYSDNKPIKYCREKIINNIYDFLEKAKLASKESVRFSDIRNLDYANVIFYKDTIDMYHKSYIQMLYDYKPLSKTVSLLNQWGYLYDSFNEKLFVCNAKVTSCYTLIYKTADYLNGGISSVITDKLDTQMGIAWNIPNREFLPGLNYVWHVHSKNTLTSSEDWFTNRWTYYLSEPIKNEETISDIMSEFIG